MTQRVAGKRHRRLASRSLEARSRHQVGGFGNIPSRFLKLIERVVSGCLLAIDFIAMADAKDKNDQAVVFDLPDEPVIAYTVFPELPKPRAVQRLSNAARIV